MSKEVKSPKEVTPEWVKENLDQLGLKQKDIIDQTDIDKSNLSLWINGKGTMSRPVKAMFYFMIELFKSQKK